MNAADAPRPAPRRRVPASRSSRPPPLRPVRPRRRRLPPAACPGRPVREEPRSLPPPRPPHNSGVRAPSFASQAPPRAMCPFLRPRGAARLCPGKRGGSGAPGGGARVRRVWPPHAPMGFCSEAQMEPQSRCSCRRPRQRACSVLVPGHPGRRLPQ